MTLYGRDRRGARVRREGDSDCRAGEREDAEEHREATEAAVSAAEKHRKYRRDHDADQRESLAHRGDAGALDRIARQLRTPCLVVDRRQAERAVDEGERQAPATRSAAPPPAMAGRTARAFRARARERRATASACARHLGRRARRAGDRSRRRQAAIRAARRRGAPGSRPDDRRRISANARTTEAPP